MALPVSFNANLSVGPQNSYHGPFKSSGGDFYTVLRGRPGSADLSQISLQKAIDPTDSFSEQASSDLGAGDSNIGSFWCSQVADIIHTVAQFLQTTGTNPHDVYYSSANISADTLAAGVLIENLGTDDDGPNAVACFVAVRATGDIIVVYQGDPEMLMGTEYARIDANKSTDDGATWSGTGFPLAVDDGGNDHWVAPVIVAGDSNRMHIFFKNDDLDDAYQRAMASDDGLETFPSSFDDTIHSDLYPFGPGIPGSTVYCPYKDAAGTTSIVSLTSADAPSPSTTTGVGDNTVRVVNDNVLHAMASDGADRYLVYVDNISDDLFRDIDTGSGWGTDVEFLDNITCNHISPNIYDRSGTKLAYIYDDAGTIKYNEVDISIAFTNLSDVKFPDQNYFTGPFDI